MILNILATLILLYLIIREGERALQVIVAHYAWGWKVISVFILLCHLFLLWAVWA